LWIISTTTNMLIENNLIHDTPSEHNIYLGQNLSDAGAITGLIVRGNVLYTAPRDNFHINGLCTGGTLDGNIMYGANYGGSGGSSNIQLQEGWNHSLVQNNLVFVSSAYPFAINNYFGPGAVGGGPPTIIEYDQNYNTTINNTFILTGIDTSGVNAQNHGFGPLGVIHDTINPWVANHSYAAGGGNGSGYTIDAANHVQYVTTSGVSGSLTPSWNDSGGSTTDGTVIWKDFGTSVHDLGHNTYSNNLLVNLDATQSADISVQYRRGTSLDADWVTTDTWTNNIVFSPVTSVRSWANCVGCSSTLAPSPLTWAQFGSAAATFTGNLQSDPKLTATNIAWYTAPLVGSWNPRMLPTSPARGIGASCPGTDITGATRSTCDSGAYAYQAAAGIPPTITSASPVTTGQVSVAYSFQFTATGDATLTWACSGCPAWSTFSTSTGLLSGTPNATGVSHVSVSVSNASGSAGPIVFDLTINPPPGPVLTLIPSGVRMPVSVRQ
jgi:hypothetical protein